MERNKERSVKSFILTDSVLDDEAVNLLSLSWVPSRRPMPSQKSFVRFTVHGTVCTLEAWKRGQASGGYSRAVPLQSVGCLVGNTSAGHSL
jgi:hypothetical protein